MGLKPGPIQRSKEMYTRRRRKRTVNEIPAIFWSKTQSRHEDQGKDFILDDGTERSTIG